MIAENKRFSLKTGQNTRITVQGLGGGRENDMSDEREAIVVWLREMADICEAALPIGLSPERIDALQYAADAIQRGDHLAPKE